MNKPITNFQLNGMEYIFKALFLSPEGAEAVKQGLITSGIDEYYKIKNLVLVLSQIESYYETDNMQLGQTCCNVIMKSGVTWTLLITMAELIELRKSPTWFNN